MKLALVCLLAVAACTDLPTFDETCGNFVIDSGEDCDEDPLLGNCDQCRVVCDEEFRECGGVEGYVCGTDGFCHAPSGKLSSEVHEQAFPGNVFTITDVDRDYVGDVVSVSDTSLIVNYGDPSGDLSFQLSTLIPTARGEPSFADLDSDGSTDVLIPTTDGLVAYSSPRNAVSPHPFIVDIGDIVMCTNPVVGGRPFTVFPLDGEHLGLLITRDSDKKLAVAVLRADSESTCPTQVVEVCGTTVGDLFETQLHITYDTYDTSTPDDPLTAGDSSQSGKVIAVTSDLSGGGVCVVNFTRPANAAAFSITSIMSDPMMKSRPTLIDLDGTGCPSLIDATAAPTFAEYGGSGTPGTCLMNGPVGRTLLTTLAMSGTMFGVNANTNVIGRALLQPPLPAVLGFAAQALVTDQGVYAIKKDRSAGLALYHSDRELSSVQTGDIDDDGDLDIIAIAEGDDDIDVIQRTSTNNFLLLRLDTIGPVVYSVVGDFDGNESADVAYTEIADASQHLMISFGTRDRPLEAQDLGSFRQVVGLVPIQLTDSTDPARIVDDLMILDLPENRTSPVLTALHGSPQRTMQSFFDPRLGARNMVNSGPTFFVGVAGGQFFPSAVDPITGVAPRYTDLLAVDYAPIGGNAEMWPSQGVDYGVLEYSSNTQTTAMTRLSNCAGNTASSGTTNFCFNTGRYVTWPRASHDVVIGVDSPGAGNRHMVVIDPLTFGSKAVSPTAQLSFPMRAELSDGALARLNVRSLRIANVDEDAEPELIVSLGPERKPNLPPDNTAGAIFVCQVDANGVPTSCTNVTATIPLLAGLGCVDAVPANVTPRGRLDPTRLDNASDLVVACHRTVLVPDPMPTPGPITGDPLLIEAPESELFRISHDDLGFHAQSLIKVPGSIEIVQSDDVTGDGLDDILGIRVQDMTVPTLLVIPQCAASDETCKTPAFDVIPIGETP